MNKILLRQMEDVVEIVSFEETIFFIYSPTRKLFVLERLACSFEEMKCNKRKICFDRSKLESF